ncbi:hypothetical protein BN903_23 [Halorubrum sp. AJ67]|nr:hypothetical protein BN903_23 [Halorubrum sp. AJ67]
MSHDTPIVVKPIVGGSQLPNRFAGESRADDTVSSSGTPSSST